MKSSTPAIRTHGNESSAAANTARRTHTNTVLPETIRTGDRYNQRLDAAVNAFIANPSSSRERTLQIRRHGHDEAILAEAWKRSFIKPALGMRHTRSYRNVQSRNVQSPLLPPTFPTSDTVYSTDGRFIWSEFERHIDPPSKHLHDLLSGVSHRLQVGNSELGSDYTGVFSDDCGHFYAYGHFGCHVFDVRGFRPTLIKSVYISNNCEKIAESEPASHKQRAIGKTATKYLERVGGICAKMGTKLVGYDESKAYIALTSRQGPALFVLEGHTACIDGVATSNHCNNIVTFSQNESLRWTFDDGVAHSTPLAGLTSRPWQSGIILDDSTLLIANDFHGAEVVNWQLSDSVWARTGLTTDVAEKTEALTQSARGEFVALLGKTHTRFLRKTDSGYQSLALWKHPNMPNKHLDNSKFEPKNPRLFSIAHDRPWLWIGDESVNLIDISGPRHINRKRPIVSDDQQQMYICLDGKLTGYDLSGPTREPLKLPTLPDNFCASNVIAQNKVVVALSADGKTAWHWRHDINVDPRLIRFPGNSPSFAEENAVSNDGKLLCFVADNAAYVLDLSAPDAVPLSLKDEVQHQTDDVALVAGGTIALVVGSTTNDRSVYRHFDLAADVPVPRAKI